MKRLFSIILLLTVALRALAVGSHDDRYTKHWTCDGHDYQNSMTMVGVINVDGVELQSDAIEIGAFCDGVCRGSEIASYYPNADRYLVFLTVYGSANDLITFRLYNHWNGLEYNDDIESVTFTVNAILGSVGNPYVFDFSSNVTYYSITTNVLPSGTGNVTGGGDYQYGRPCTLTASPNSGYKFLYWMKDGEEIATNATYSFTVTENATYSACFATNATYNPHWTANPHQYEHTMTMVGVVEIDGVEQRVPYYEVGAFCGSECRGSAMLEYLPRYDKYLAFLTVYGDDGNNINFRLFNQSSWSEVYKQALSLSFVTDTICGNPDEPYVFNFTDFLTITTQLQPSVAGTVNGGGEYMPGEICTLTAVPLSVYSFINWTKDGVVVSNSATYSFVVTENATYTANFEWINPGGEYIADGLIMYLDGIYNTRDGHESSTDVWEDLTGNYDLMVTGYSSYAWEDNHFIGLGNGGYLNTGKSWKYFNSLNNDITIEIVTYIDCDKTYPSYRGLAGWHIDSDGTNFQNDQGSGRMQTLGLLPVAEADNTISTVTYTRTNGSFINGEWETADNNIYNGVYSNRTVVFGNSYAQSRGWNDSIYCIRMYNKTLTPEEIAYNHSIDMERFGAVAHPVDTTIYANICYGDDYLLDGFEILNPEVGEETYSIKLTSTHGIDSIVYLTLTVNPVFYMEADTSLCNSSPFQWHGKTYTESGIYYDTLQTIHGCDSIFQLNLEFFDTPLGEFTYMSPTDNYPFTSLPITFTWDAVNGADYYDLYVWDEDDPMPSLPFVTNLTNGYYSTTALPNYNTYNWFVTAKNTCNEVSSSVRSFYLDIMPTLNVNVNDINFGEVALNQSTSTTLTVSGVVLEDTLSVEIVGPDAEMFSFVKASGWNDYTGGILILTFHPTAVQYSYDADLVVTSGILGQTVSLTGGLADMFVFNTYVDDDVYAMNTAIPIYGSLYDVNNNPVANAEVEVGVFVMNTKRTLQAVTNESGQFMAIFEPYSSESGYYTINSGRPGNNSTVIHDDFNIPGMMLVSGNYNLCAVTQDQPHTDSILIRNKSNLALSNITVSTTTAPDGASFSFMPLSLGGLEEGYLIYTATGSTLTEGNYYQEAKLQASSSEGAMMNFSIWYYCMEAHGILDVAPKSIATTMTKGVSKIIDVMLTNNGTAETGSIYIDLPAVEWMSVVGSDTLSSIAVNDTAYFSLRFSPGDDIALVQYTGTIAINSERGDGIALPYQITAVAETTGDLVIDVTDDFTWNTNRSNGPHLANAEVTLTGYYSLEVVAHGYTDDNGLFQVDDLPEGYYRLHVSANKHSEYDQVIQIAAGETNNREIYLQYQAVTYSLNVVPTEIEDEYIVQLDVVYETHVPAPAVVIELSSQVPELDDGESFTFNAIVTNHGLIAVKDFQLIVPDVDGYLFNPLYDFIDSLPAQTTVLIPVTVSRIQTTNYNRSSQSINPCLAKLGAMMYYYCGSDHKWHRAYSKEVFINTCAVNAIADFLESLIWWEIPLGGGGSGGGGASDDIVDPVPYVDIGCNPCDEYLRDLALSAPVLGELSYLADNIPGNEPDPYGHFLYWGGKLPVIGEIIAVGQFAVNLWDYFHCKLESRNQSLGLGDFEYIFRFNDDMIALYSELYQDTLLYEKIGFELLNSLLMPYYENIVEISEADANSIKSNFTNLDISDESINVIINRWNQTVVAWNNNVFEPNTDYPNIINRVHLESICTDIREVYTYANSIGYESLYDMAEDLLIILDDETGESETSVCSTVKVRFSQKMTLTREAFEGTLTIHNGHESEPMQAIDVDFLIKDAEGNDCTSLFQINTLSLTKLTGIDGSGSLDAGFDGIAKIQFIPTKQAALTEPKVYYFGGSLSFIDPYYNVDVSYQLYPVAITVNPCPDLYVDYFMQHDIIGDDALTLDKVEPSIPAELGVIINNKGAGTAKNVILETAEPEIIDNEKGLAIDFAMYGASFNGSPRQLGLMEIPFGNIASGHTAVGEWLFTSSLLGHFISYEAHVIHNNSYDNPNLSLVSSLKIHELIHPIYAYGNFDDGINDFLVNDVMDAYDMPDSIYFSHGGKTVVGIVDNISFDHYVEPLDTIVTLTINPSRIGWNYGVTDDPGMDKYDVVSCTRDIDGQEIPLQNVWQTFVTIPDDGDPVYENKLHIIDTLSNNAQDYTYTLVYSLKTNLLDIEEISGIPEEFIEYPLESFTVKFNEAIVDSTFTYEDMTLKCNNGPNLMNQSVVITKIDETTYEVNISGITNETGFFVLNVNTLNICDTRGYGGYNGKQASWVQVITNYTQTNTLTSGWNWWSTYIDMSTEQDFDKLKNALGSNASMIKSRTEGFVTYYGDWYGTLNMLTNTEMYMINMNSMQNISIVGPLTSLSGNPITLNQGWNWIGYPTNMSQEINAALVNLPALGSDMLKSRNAFATYYPSLGWIGTLTNLSPGTGYMYNSSNTETVSFVYASPSKMENQPQEVDATNHWEVSVGEYETNATIIGVIDINSVEQRDENLIVGAFIGDRCVGQINALYVEAIDRYFVFLTYFGNENDQITFRMYDEANDIEYGESETTVLFEPNSMLGTVDNPFVINFNISDVSENGFAQLTLFPNPVNAGTNVIIRLNNNLSGKLDIEIITSLGTEYDKITSRGNVVEMKAPDIPGIYMVKITDKNGNVNFGKLIVK